MLPSWYVGHYPENHVLLLSGTGDLSRGFSRAVRDTLGEPRYRDVFPETRPDPSKGWAEDAWFLWRPNRSDPHPTCRAVGVFGPAIGRRGDLIVVDDPHDDQTAYSDIKRAHVKRWLHQVVLSRARPDARIVVILTRWHLDDIASDLIADGWLVVHQPAINEAGEALWKEEWPLDRLEQMRREQGNAIFAAMYQGDPTALGSLVFSDRHFRTYTEDADSFFLHRITGEGEEAVERVDKSACHTVQAVDPAIATGADSDFTAIVTVAVTPHGDRLVRDVLRSRIAGPDQRGAIVAEYGRWHPIQVGVERVAFQLSLVQDLRRHTGLPIKELHPDKDKRARALRVAALYESEKVFHPSADTAPWLREFEMELLEFPVARHDDQVDALAYACELSDMPAAGLVEWYRQQVEAGKERRAARAGTRT